MHRILLAATLLLAPFTLGADEGKQSLSGWLALSVMEFDYEETELGVLQSREEGTLPGFDAGLALKSGHWFAETGITWWSGRVDYSAIGASSRTDEDIIDLDIIIGRQLPVTGRIDPSLYAGIGYRDWQRDIRSTPTATGLDEEYTWWYGLVGLRLASAINQRLTISGDLQVTQTVNPEIEVDFMGLFDRTHLDLGEETGYRASLTIENDLGNNATLWLAPWYEYWELGRSATVPLLLNGIPTSSTVFEPRSETRNFGINLGVTWRFQ